LSVKGSLSCFAQRMVAPNVVIACVSRICCDADLIDQSLSK
jgi:hypothetical protein